MGGDNTGQRGGRKLVSLKGVVMVDTVRGVLRIRKWPKKRPTRSAAQLAAEDKFRQANVLYRYLDPRQQIVYMQSSAGTPFYPRDLFVANVYGRGPGWRDPNTGVKYLSMPLMIDVSDSLDVFTQTEGGILVRGEKYWEALSPGSAGFVLTSNGPDSKPSFQAGGGGGSTALGCTIQRSTGQTTVGSYNFQVVTFDTEVVDEASYWAIGSPTQFVIPSDGWFSLECRGKAAALFGSGREFRAELNGTDTPGSGTLLIQDGRSALSGYNDPWFSIQHFVKLTAADVVRFFLSGRESIVSVTSIEASVVRL